MEYEKDSHVVLAVFPNVRGFGYACIDVPTKLMEYGSIRIKQVSKGNGKILKRVQKFIEFFKPEVVILRDCKKSYPRGYELIKKITAIAVENNIPVYKYSRLQVRDVFEIWGLKTKQEIAIKITEIFPDLTSRLPKIKKSYQEEDRNMVMFDAVALALTHEYLNA
jgi:Holliday junction resolvasome RuvABC endonuclease subunit